MMSALPPLVDVRLPSLALPATTGAAVDASLVPGLVIVFVYPYTGRPGVADPPDWDSIRGAHGSTPEAIGFRDTFDAFLASNITLLGLSGQSPDWQREFAVRTRLPFPLLSDQAFAFADALGLPRFATGGVRYLTRLTMIVRDGVILETVYPIPQPATHAADLLARFGKTANAVMP